MFYNLVENFPIILLNNGIMLKEAVLPFFQLINNRKAPSHKDRIQIGLYDIEDSFFFFTNMVNPAYIGSHLFKWILGWDPKDMVIENKSDEDHYYAGKAYKGIKGYIKK